MKLLIGIATYKRPEKLKRLLESLNKQTHQDFLLNIVFDNKDWESANKAQKAQWFDWTRSGYRVNSAHEFVIGAWNKTINEYIHHSYWQGFIGLCDDVELAPNALEIIVKLHQQTFPDTDGVLGFNQECPGHPEYTFKWFGQTLMGRKFVERYKDGDYKICCPDYKHFFQDQEMYTYALSLGKFFACPQAVLYHYHPGFITQEKDETHDIIRSGSQSPRSHDFDMFKQRSLKKYLWGKDFNLISEGK